MQSNETCRYSRRFIPIACNSRYFHIAVIRRLVRQVARRKLNEYAAVRLFYTHNIYTRFDKRILEGGISLKRL